MNPNDLDLRLLRSFLAVAQCGKISTAAKQLHLSQPAVTAHLRRLEEIMGNPHLVGAKVQALLQTGSGYGRLPAGEPASEGSATTSRPPETQLGGAQRKERLPVQSRLALELGSHSNLLYWPPRQ